VEGAVTQTLLALAATLGAVVLARILLQRHSLTSRRSRRLSVLESVSLGPKQRLHMIEVGNEVLLLASTESVVNLIRRVPRERPDTPWVASDDDAEPARDSERSAQSATSVRPWLKLLGCLIVAGLALSAIDVRVASAQAAVSASAPASLSISLQGVTGPEKISSTLQVVALLTLISIAPSILLMGTCFTRILVVFVLLRQAMGTASLPPNQILVGLALFTTVYVMAPVGEAIHSQAIEPYVQQEIDAGTALVRGIAPARDYLLAHTREKDLKLFLELAGKQIPEDVDEVELATLLPAYMISEIRTAFEIGFMIYLPFLVIDLVIASMLLSLGMIMLPPVMISLPFKLMLFVLMDGWNLTLTALVSGLQ